MTEKRPGPAPGVRLIEVSVKRELTVYLSFFSKFICIDVVSRAAEVPVIDFFSIQKRDWLSV